MTKIPLVDLPAQYLSLKPEIDAAIAAVIVEAAFVGTSENHFVSAFERQFADYVGAQHCIACGNGTDALEILLKACGLGPGNEVIVPAVSWIATSEAVSTVGACPVFVDIDAASYTISPARIEAAITPRTGAIVPVHLYGLPAAMDPILDLAARHRLVVIEDCAQAHGARYKGRPVGTMGHAAAFSFFPGKNLGAYGDAGAMLTNDDEVAERARMISQHGQTRTKHDHRIEGRNSRMDGINAAVLAVKLRHLERWTEARRAHARRYDEFFASSGFQRQAAPPDLRHVYHLYTVQVSNRDAIQQRLREAGIMTGIQYPRALPALSAYAHRGYRDADFPAANRLATRTLSLPMYPEMSDEIIERVATALLSVAESAA